MITTTQPQAFPPHSLSQFSFPGFSHTMDRDNFLDIFFNHNYDNNNLPNFIKPMQINTNNILDNSKIARVSSTPSMDKCLKTKMEIRAMIGLVASPNEVSSISEQNSVGKTDEKSSFVSRKRKSVSRGQSQKMVVDENDNQVKRCKSDEIIGNNEKQNEKPNEPKTKAPDPPKDYIHVRARRGQATDSHSLAERVRREKIGERMKLLQDLVPGCNKITGKALMLDEIINYVQSLQQQVELLSMKLASVDPMDFNTGSLLSKDVTNSTYPSHSSSSLRQQQQDIHHARIDFSALGSFDPSGTTLYREGLQQVPLVDEFGQFSGSYEDDLQSLVQMGFSQNPSSKPWFHSQIYPDYNLLNQNNE